MCIFRAKDSKYGEYVRARYSEEVFYEYWKEVFKDCYIGTIGFDEHINEYLVWGFSLEKLCSLVNYSDKEETPQYEEFVKRIMDAKLHLENKNCEDILKINQEESAPYTIFTLMAQLAFAGAGNKKIDRYIPIDEIKKVLINELGDKCDVENLIEEYLQKEKQEQEIKISKVEEDTDLETLCEQDASEVFQQIMDIKRKKIMEECEKYNITTHEELRYYETGDSIAPDLLHTLKQSFAFYCTVAEEDFCKQLMERSPGIRCRWLVEQNRSILIRKQDWNKIFTDIEEHEEAFIRYYPMVRLKLDHTDLIYMTIAIVLNDDLYTINEQIA